MVQKGPENHLIRCPPGALGRGIARLALHAEAEPSLDPAQVSSVVESAVRSPGPPGYAIRFTRFLKLQRQSPGSCRSVTAPALGGFRLQTCPCSPFLLRRTDQVLTARAGAGLCGRQTRRLQLCKPSSLPCRPTRGVLPGASNPSGDISAQRHALQEFYKAQGGHLWH